MGYGTDMLKAYENFIPQAKQFVGKIFTTQIESLNCRLRHYLASFHRKTLCYSKSKTMLEVSLKLLIHELDNPEAQTLKIFWRLILESFGMSLEKPEIYIWLCPFR